MGDRWVLLVTGRYHRVNRCYCVACRYQCSRANMQLKNVLKIMKKV